jgi:transposase-like protein
MKRKSKEEIIAEYLSGDYTFRELGTKHNIPFRTIAGWVWAYQGKTISWREKMKHRKEKQTGVKEPELPKELKLLQKELRKQQMHNKLLEEIIRIGEKQTGVDWKKKFGTKRS